jgi:hypothetical protein
MLFVLVRFNRFLWLRHFLTGIYLFLLIYHMYDAGMILLFGESPILANDLMLLKGGFYLMIDIFFSRKIIDVIMVLMILGGILLLVPYLFKAVFLGLQKYQKSNGFRIAGIAMGVVIILNNLWFSFHDFRPTIQWISPKIISNLQKSRQLNEYFKEATHRPADSTYYQYSQIHLSEKPNIYIFMVESYGRVLLDNPESRPVYQDFIMSMEDTLEGNGWKARSTFSKAPIFGGRSWLSMGSFICGIELKDQVIYSYFINRQKDYPHLIHFFNRQGYQTFALQPLNRSRPGYSLTSYERFYQYQTYIHAEDLNFDSSAFGFHKIPDQYSLNYTHDRYLKNLEEPYLLFFLTISSHSPWTFLPPYVTDWREIKTSSIQALREKYRHTSGRFKQTMQTHLISGVGLQEYLNLMFYELKIIRDYILQKMPENSIVIILGDHQPPIVTDQNDGFETPLHIISQDSVFLKNLDNSHFSGGLLLDSSSASTLTHAGIYSLLVRNLARTYSESRPLPPFLPEGTILSIQKE